MERSAIFAGGCFWCMVKPFSIYSGIMNIVSGYIGGSLENPTYKDVCSGNTGHYEAIKIDYNDEIIDYSFLLDVFWKQVDPFDDGGQFADRGEQYKTAIFYCDDEQRRLAEDSIIELEKEHNHRVATKILKADTFYAAEEYHQDYHIKNSNHYNIYYKQSGRYNFVKGQDRRNFDRECLKERLTNLEFEVTQNDMTEIPFENKYFDNFDKGIYVDIVDGTPLFSSKDKLNCNCGWPSFSKPIDERHIHSRTDYSFGMIRTEVRSLKANSHLGHLYEDGADDMGGVRYYINSAALKFIPYEEMEENGYCKYMKELED